MSQPADIGIYVNELVALSDWSPSSPSPVRNLFLC